MQNRQLPPGTLVILPDGTYGWATPNRRVGQTWDQRTYRVRLRDTDEIVYRDIAELTVQP